MMKLRMMTGPKNATWQNTNGLTKIKEELHTAQENIAVGLRFQVKSFEFFLSLLLFEKIFSITDKLSNLLQAVMLSCIDATKRTISNLRSEENWAEIWEEAVSMAERHNISITPKRGNRINRLPTHLHCDLVRY